MKLSKYKNRYKIKPYLILTIGFFLITVSAYFLYESYALYEEAKDFNVINGIVEDPGDIYFAYYIDDKISRTMPKQNTGYTLDTDKSSCTNDVKITWNYSTWQGVTDYTNYSTITNSRTKCTLYFKKTSTTISTVLGNLEVNSYTPDYTKSACDDETCESHEKGIYETTDYDGNPTYYYRGSVENNYVKFAGYYWRIIRINSNGSIRMIYDGTSAHSNGESSDDRQYGTSQFSSLKNDNMYVGYMYSQGNAHGVSTSSTIKINVDKFYTEKLASYSLKIDNSSGYCGDRSTLNSQNDAGVGSVVTYNKGYLRVEENNPTLVCENESDYYTTNNASKGNKALSYPIGLITADEVMLAGHAVGIFNGQYNHMKKNKNAYLNISKPFWTMTPAGSYIPFGYTVFSAIIFGIYTTGAINDFYVTNDCGVRPVINIRSDVTINGSGTITDPYVVN